MSVSDPDHFNRPASGIKAIAIMAAERSERIDTKVNSNRKKPEIIDELKS